jgi:glycerol-3-phosphate acyltransferase PlsY
MINITINQMLFWSIIGFISSSIPWAVIFTKLIAHKNIRTFGDGNPGGVNSWKASGWQLGLPVICIEILKAAIPIAFAKYFGLNGWELLLPGFSVILGHSFSPFLKFKGGKSIAVSGGLWAGLTPWGTGFLMLCICIGLCYLIIKNHAWITVIGIALGGISCILLSHIFFGEVWFSNTSAIWTLLIGNLLLLIVKHWTEFKESFAFRNWATKLLRIH